jgi:hypothetical protein
VRTCVGPTRAARRHAMTPSRRCRPTPHPCAALPHAPPRSLKLQLSFLMLAPVDVTRLSLLPTVSGRGDTIPGGAPSFSLRGNDDPKDGHSFFWREPPSLLSPSPHFSLLLSSRLSPSSSSLLQAGGDGEKTLCELSTGCGSRGYQGGCHPRQDTGELAGCLNPSSSPNHLSINQITRVCTEMSGWEFSFKNFGCMEWEAGLERRGKGR